MISITSIHTRLVHKTYRSSTPGLPVAAYDDLPAFKIYLVDVGLFRRLAQLAPMVFDEINRRFPLFTADAVGRLIGLALEQGAKVALGLNFPALLAAS